ncbi:hypothetical protein EV385_1252 [Krasilnikovia cinnamomea]|uniref:Serine-threonine protein kinase n=1 Tax=Krasilnikovia cinnamomea TaxID=349313 RepID=A0A4Q7ZFF8_9ACTN|nr:hypothetical protein [Krasilnikovia cinnamomea]RZU49500.1 hypothetical protein EV385_1252 [Krasilnikovia cinnamomea]
MTDQLPVGPYRMVRTAEGTAVPWYVVPFDSDGACTGPRTRDDLVNRARGGGFTDIVIFCHGWNNDWRQATGRYDDFFNGYVRLRTERALPAAPGFAPLLVAIFWPSKLLVADADQPPDFAGDGDADDAAVADERDDLAELAAAVDPDHRPRLFELAQQRGLDEADALELAGILAPLYATDREETAEQAPPTPAEIAASWQAPRRRRSADPADFDTPTTTVDGAPQAAGWADFLRPREILRGASVWLMKDRAGRVGARGVGPLLVQLLGTGARVHVVGHSFGAKVLLSAIAAPAALPATVHSALLLEPAVSHLCFAADADGHGRPGGYRPVLDRVGQPILSTFSGHDEPLHKFFHLALRRAGDLGEADIAADEPPSRYAALGGYGPRPLGAQATLTPILDPTTRYALDAPGLQVVGVDGTRTIPSHGEVSNPSTWWMLYDLMTR